MARAAGRSDRPAPRNEAPPPTRGLAGCVHRHANPHGSPEAHSPHRSAAGIPQTDQRAQGPCGVARDSLGQNDPEERSRSAHAPRCQSLAQSSAGGLSTGPAQGQSPAVRPTRVSSQRSPRGRVHSRGKGQPLPHGAGTAGFPRTKTDDRPPCVRRLHGPQRPGLRNHISCETPQRQNVFLTLAVTPKTQEQTPKAQTRV